MNKGLPATDSNGVILEMSTFDAVTSVIIGVTGFEKVEPYFKEFMR